MLLGNLTYDEKIAEFKKIIEDSKRIVFFGGAGVSTGSGIPDFRSANGLYNNIDPEFSKYSPEYLLSRACFIHQPKVFYKFYKNFMDARPYEPNVVHKYLADLEKSGKLTGIVTQNIDMLHEKAGSKKIYKIHGTIGTNHCIQCHKEFGIDYVFDSEGAIPRCTCNGSNNFVRPNVVLYGENLPSDMVKASYDVLGNADCLIVAGTSLSVQPAAGMVSDYYGKYMIILNHDPTKLDDFADIVFHEDMNQVFADLQK